MVSRIYTDEVGLEVSLIYSETRNGRHVVSFIGCSGLESERYYFATVGEARVKWAELVRMVRQIGFMGNW